MTKENKKILESVAVLALLLVGGYFFFYNKTHSKSPEITLISSLAMMIGFAHGRKLFMKSKEN